MGVYRNLFFTLHIIHSAVWESMLDTHDFRTGFDDHTQRSCFGLEQVDQRAHSAHWDAPFPRALANYVIKERPVLKQRGIFGIGGNTDLCIGEDQTAKDIVG